MPLKEFLDKLSGRGKKTFSQPQEKYTYARHYDESRPLNKLRHLLAYSDIEMQRQGEKLGGSVVVEKLEMSPCSPARYAMGFYQAHIEAISGCSLDVLGMQLDTYSVHYIIHYYFKAVSSPADNDLVVYSRPQKREIHYPLVGIFKYEQKQDNNFAPGGSVISKYRRSSPYVFEHALFFTPDFYGPEADFFRIKTEPVVIGIPLPLQPAITNPMMTPIPYGDGFSYAFSQASEGWRKHISRTHPQNINQLVPLERISHIEFKGVCYNYAFQKFLDFYDRPPSIFWQRIQNPKILDQYFDPTHYPEPGDLVIYYDAIGSAVHYGIYLSENWIESKWGEENVFRHNAFDVPIEYGHRMKCFKLKPGLTKEQVYEALRQEEAKQSTPNHAKRKRC